MRIAPWPDYAGNKICEGDTIKHPSGDTGKVVFLIKEHNPCDHVLLAPNKAG